MIDFALAKYRWTAVAIVVLALLMGIGVQTVRVSTWQTKHANLMSAAAREKQRLAEEHAADVTRMRDAEVALQKKVDDQRKKDAHEISDLRARHADAVASLRNRPAARAEPAREAASAASSGVGGTGAGLSEPDAAVALWFAAEAARLGVERDSCRRQYDDARATIDALNKER